MVWELLNSWVKNEMEWIIFICSAVAILIFCIAIFRRDSDGSGMGNDIRRAEEIRDGLDRAGDSNQRTKTGLEELGKNNQSAQGRADDIGRHNQSAKAGIRSAIDILKRAKNRKSNP